MYDKPLSNNPIDLGNYISIEPENIRGGGTMLQTCITRQFDRIDFLLTLGTAKIGGTISYFSTEQMAQAVKRGLRSIESYLRPFNKEDKEYDKVVNVIKERLRSTIRTEEETFECLAEWHDQLVERLGSIDMLPQKRIEVDLTDPDSL